MNFLKIAKTTTLITAIMTLSACGGSSDSDTDGEGSNSNTAVYAPIDPDAYTVKAICSGSDLMYTVSGGSERGVGVSIAPNDPRCITGGIKQIKFSNLKTLDQTNVYTLKSICDGRNLVAVAYRSESVAINVSQDSKNCVK